jgi:hypothetical protein
LTLKPKDDEDLIPMVEALCAKAHCHGELWGDHNSHINRLAAQVTDMKTDTSWVYNYAVHVLGDCFGKDEEKIKGLEDRLDRQNDIINDLKEQVAMLAGKVCWFDR